MGLYHYCILLVLMFRFWYIENYQKLELERKKVRTQKTAQTGPMIRYHSLVMPVLAAEDADPDVT